jgi:hypothetical protein
MKRKMNWLLMWMFLASFLAVTHLGVAISLAAQAPGPTQEWTLITPLGEIRGVTYLTPAGRPADLNGKRITLIDNTKPGAQMLMQSYQALLKERFPKATVTILRKSYGWSGMKDTLDPAFEKEVIAKSDAVVYGVGD